MFERAKVPILVSVRKIFLAKENFGVQCAFPGILVSW